MQELSKIMPANEKMSTRVFMRFPLRDMGHLARNDRPRPEFVDIWELQGVRGVLELYT